MPAEPEGVSVFGWPVAPDGDLAELYRDLYVPCAGQLPIAGEPNAGVGDA